MSISGIGSSTNLDPTQMAKEFFKKADTNSDGKISETENENQMKKMGTKGGKPPSEAGSSLPSGSAQKSTASSGSSSSSSNKVYDKKDTNKDGTVSYEEEFEYDSKHPAEANESRSNAQKAVGYNKTGNVNAGSEDSENRISLEV
jgi:hypothetical protein